MAESDADAVLVHRALMLMYVETQIAEVNHAKVMRKVFELMTGDNSAILMAMSGDALAGTASVVKTETWFADAEFFIDKWLWVAPEFRDGGVLRRILEELRDLASHVGIPVLVTHNKGRQIGKPRSQFERIAEMAIFQPRGLVLGYFP